MTTKQQRLLKGQLEKCAQNYNAAPILNLVEALQERFEESEEEGAEVIGVRLSNVILNSHIIGLSGEKTPDFYEFWMNAAAEVKAA